MKHKLILLNMVILFSAFLYSSEENETLIPQPGKQHTKCKAWVKIDGYDNSIQKTCYSILRKLHQIDRSSRGSLKIYYQDEQGHNGDEQWYHEKSVEEMIQQIRKVRKENKDW